MSSPVDRLAGEGVLRDQFPVEDCEPQDVDGQESLVQGEGGEEPQEQGEFVDEVEEVVEVEHPSRQTYDPPQAVVYPPPGAYAPPPIEPIVEDEPEFPPPTRKATTKSKSTASKTQSKGIFGVRPTRESQRQARIKELEKTCKEKAAKVFKYNKDELYLGVDKIDRTDSSPPVRIVYVTPDSDRNNRLIFNEDSSSDRAWEKVRIELDKMIVELDKTVVGTQIAGGVMKATSASGKRQSGWVKKKPKPDEKKSKTSTGR